MAYVVSDSLAETASKRLQMKAAVSVALGAAPRSGRRSEAAQLIRSAMVDGGVRVEWRLYYWLFGDGKRKSLASENELLEFSFYRWRDVSLMSPKFGTCYID